MDCLSKKNSRCREVACKWTLFQFHGPFQAFRYRRKHEVDARRISGCFSRHNFFSAPFATLETRRRLGLVNFRKDFWTVTRDGEQLTNNWPTLLQLANCCICVVTQLMRRDISWRHRERERTWKSIAIEMVLISHHMTYHIQYLPDRSFW